MALERTLGLDLHLPKEGVRRFKEVGVVAVNKVLTLFARNDGSGIPLVKWRTTLQPLTVDFELDKELDKLEPESTFFGQMTQDEDEFFECEDFDDWFKSDS